MLAGISQRDRLLERIPLAILIVFLVWCCWSIGATIFDSLHTYGDAGAEAALLMGVRNFLRYGFVETHFFPIHNSSPAVPLKIVATWLYDRYPPGPDLIAGVIGQFVQDGVFWPYRILPTIFNLAAIYLLFRLCNDVLRNAWLALFIAFAYAMNYSFMKMADSFYYSGYAEFLRILIPWAVYRQFCVSRTAAEAKRWLIVVIVASFFNVWITFDYVLSNMITSFLLVLLFAPDRPRFGQRVWWSFLAVVPIGLVTLVAITTRLMQSGWANNSIWGAIHTFYMALIWRVFNQIPGAEWYSTRIDLSNVARIIIHRTQYSFGLNWTHVLVGLALLGALCLGFRRFALVRRYGAFLLAIFVGNISYIVMLPAWAQEHYGIIGIRHILPTYGILIGGGLFLTLWFVFGEPGRRLGATVVTGVKTARRSGGYSAATTGLSVWIATVTACAFTAFAFGTTLQWNFQDTIMLWRTSAQNSWAKHFADFDKLREHMVPNSAAFGNAHWFRPEARYRIDRFSLGAWGLEELHNQSYWARSAEETLNLNRKPPLLPVGEFEAYFIFYQRWGAPDDGFFPNFTPAERSMEMRTRNLLAWLQANATLVASAGKWSLFQLKRLPTADEVKAANQQ